MGKGIVVVRTLQAGRKMNRNGNDATPEELLREHNGRGVGGLVRRRRKGISCLFLAGLHKVEGRATSGRLLVCQHWAIGFHDTRTCQIYAWQQAARVVDPWK